MNQEDNETIPRPIHPLWLVPICLVAGLVTGGPFAGAILFRCGYRRLGWGLGAGLMLIGAGVLLLAGLWGVQWYWVALTLAFVHLVCGSILFYICLGPFKRFQNTHPAISAERGTYRHTFGGIVGGALIGGLFGTVFSIPYALLSDRLFSTAMPVAFDDTLAMFRVISSGVFITLSGIIAGGFLGRFRPRMSPWQTMLYGLFLVWIYQTWMLGMDITIAMPAFQANSATTRGWYTLFIPLVLLDLFIACWWTVFLLFFITSPGRILDRVFRFCLVFPLNVAAALTISITLGYPGDLLLGLGKHLERTAHTAMALKCYELGLEKEPKPQIASYLQYRVALLNHKLGERLKAREGFNRVVAKYNGNEELVKKANRFLDNIDQKPEGKRVVLPGVETRTEYKGGYCVPNSLALVMRYWGKDVSARTIGRKITGLGTGTIIVDQRWFAEQQGWRHDFLPMAGIDDIKRCIDAGFPVLVYVPAHVFAILGYDDVLETFVTYDVASRDIWEEYIRKDFIKSWKKQAGTLVLSYPPEKEDMIPDDIRDRLASLSDNYIHFQLHYFDAPKGSLSVPHLWKAAGANGAFFFPVTVLYSEFPSLRATIDKQYDANRIAEEIKTYFWSDFDEGVHLAGQQHDNRWSRQDWALDFAVSYLIDHGQTDLVDALISRIDNQGQVSAKTLEGVGLMDLSKGRIQMGLDRVQTSNKAVVAFYSGLARLKTGETQGAVRDLAKAVKGRT
jgi:hypothetical protein